MLYYSGAPKPEDTQTNPTLSLGGYKSSSQIPNGDVHNLFPKITRQTVVNNIKTTRMIVFINETPATINNLKLWVEETELAVIKLAAILPGYDSQCSRYFFEKITNDSQLPYQGTLSTYTQTSPLEIPSLESGKMIGIWLRRELKIENFNTIDKGEEFSSCEEVIIALEENQETSVSVEDVCKIDIQWD